MMKKVIFMWFCFFIILFSCKANDKSNRKLFSEKNESDIDVILENIEEKNDDKILNDILVSYKYEITRSGLYIFDDIFELMPLYINYESPRLEQYISYKQFESILFFYNAVGSNKHLFFDLLTNKITTIEIDEINHIRFVSQNKLIIYGTTWDIDRNNNVIHSDKVIEIEFDNRNTSNEDIGINIKGIYPWEETEKQSYVPPINNIRYQTKFLYKIFNEYIIIDCSNIIPEYASYINKELNYIEKLNKYIFWVDNFGELE